MYDNEGKKTNNLGITVLCSTEANLALGVENLSPPPSMGGEGIKYAVGATRLLSFECVWGGGGTYIRIVVAVARQLVPRAGDVGISGIDFTYQIFRQTIR